MVGLDPNLEGYDIPFFNMSRARLPNAVFREIVQDLRVFLLQYGPIDRHKNKEARARYLSGVYSPSSFKSPITI